MPKAKITQNSGVPQSSNTATNRTPVKINTSGTPKWYIVIIYYLVFQRETLQTSYLEP